MDCGGKVLRDAALALKSGKSGVAEYLAAAVQIESDNLRLSNQNACSWILLDRVSPYALSCRYSVLGEIPRISEALP